MRLTREQCWVNLRAGDHAALCTFNPEGLIDAVPVCFAVVGTVVASPIDVVKAKDTTELTRLGNLERNATATLLCERWDPDDWSRLWWVRARLVRRSAHDIDPHLREDCVRALKEKYVQYRTTEFAHVLVFDVTALTGWSAAGPAGGAAASRSPS